MALPDTIVLSHGSAVIWGESGGSGVTLTLSLNALANGAGRMGAVADLGANFYDEYAVGFQVETGTAPTAGTTAELYLASTDNTARYPGTVTGSDATYTFANRFQLGPPLIVLYALNLGNTVLTQQGAIFRPIGRYVVPVVVNNLGQAFRNQGTPASNLSRVILMPRIPSIIE